MALMLLTSGCATLPATSQTPPSAPTPDRTANVVADGGIQLTLEQTTYNYDGKNITALKVTSLSDKPCDIVMNAS